METRELMLNHKDLLENKGPHARNIQEQELQYLHHYTPLKDQ